MKTKSGKTSNLYFIVLSEPCVILCPRLDVSAVCKIDVSQNNWASMCTLPIHCLNFFGYLSMSVKDFRGLVHKVKR